MLFYLLPSPPPHLFVGELQESILKYLHTEIFSLLRLLSEIELEVFQADLPSKPSSVWKQTLDQTHY